MSLVAEILGDGECRQPRPPARTRRLVHLAKDQRGAREHTGLTEFEKQLVPLARALANTGEHRNAGMPLDRGADQLDDQHGLADPGSAEHRGFAASDQWRQQVNDFDAGMEDLASAALTFERRRRTVDRSMSYVRRERWTVVHRLAGG